MGGKTNLTITYLISNLLPFSSTMASQINPNFLPLLILVLSAAASSASAEEPTPAGWPPQFHSILIINSSTGTLQKTDLWYDFPNGRNFNIIQNQLGKLLYDLEWNNGTSFYYTLDSSKECKVMHFPVGILPPNWLQGGKYVGQRYIDKFLCNVWEKADFITYYEHAVMKIPVSWTFFNGMTTHVITFEVGKVLEDSQWQAPVYCFDKAKKSVPQPESFVTSASLHHRFMRGLLGLSMSA